MNRSRLLLLGSLLCCLGCSGTEETPVLGPGTQVWTGYDPAWTVVHPAGGAARLLEACALPDGEAWAVGTGGTVIHHVGERWVRERTGTDATLADVATDGRLVCAVGGGGTILVREAGAWRREAGGTTGALRAVAFAADGAVWAGGEDGLLLRREAGAWRQRRGAASAPVAALAAIGDTLVVGYGTGLVCGLAGAGGRTLGEFGGPGLLALAVSPSGTLFAAADSLYRYDAGRWCALAGYPDRRLAANDSLVFCSGRSWRHDGDVWNYVPTLGGDDNVAVCAAGAAGALAVGQSGVIAWLSEDLPWRYDLGGGCTQQALLLADGTPAVVVDRHLLAWDEDRWRSVPLPPDVAPYGLEDGLDRSHLLLYATGGLVLAGATRSEAVPYPRLYRQLLLAPDGGLLGADNDGLIVLEGREWRREVAITAGGEPRFRLARTRAGELFALNPERMLRRQQGRWRQVAALARPTDFNFSSTNCFVAGRYPDTLVIITRDGWLKWDARADSAQADWRRYDDTRYYAQVEVCCETAGAAYVVNGRTNCVLRLRLGRVEGETWEAVTGPPPDPISTLRVEPDGAITAFSSSTGRVWRYPARPLI